MITIIIIVVFFFTVSLTSLRSVISVTNQEILTQRPRFLLSDLFACPTHIERRGFNRMVAVFDRCSQDL